MASKGSLSKPTNTKLGPLIHSWSITAGRHASCPGETSLCRARCYAKRGFFVMPTSKNSHSRNFAFSKTPLFTSWMQSTLIVHPVRVMRIHVAGDFYDSEYVSKWYTIAENSPHITFFAYTRSWQVAEMLPSLIRLSALPNMQLWWSIDRMTGPAPVIKGVRRAYMAINDMDAATAPDDCDLVFRDSPRTVMKKANGVMVCPPENGTHPKRKVTCTACGVCWNKRGAKLDDVIFADTEDPVEIVF